MEQPQEPKQKKELNKEDFEKMGAVGQYFIESDRLLMLESTKNRPTENLSEDQQKKYEKMAKLLKEFNDELETFDNF